jgi:heme A synthase
MFFYLPPLCSQWNPLSRKCPSLLRWLSVANPWPWMKRQPEKNDWMYEWVHRFIAKLVIAV